MPSNFTKPLTVTQIGTSLWRTERSFTYHVGFEGSKNIINVPKGFVTDFASVPWPASMLIPTSGGYNQAAVLHDYLYNQQFLSRSMCDQIFLEAMTALGVNPFKRQIMYRAVRLGGWLPWNHQARENKRARELKAKEEADGK